MCEREPAMRPLLAASLVFALTTGSLVVACSSSTTPSAQPAADRGSSGDPEDGGGTDDGGAQPAGPMTLTSSAFEASDALPSKYTCDNTSKKDVSPPLSWTAGPEGTASYAIVFTDETNPLVHAAIYDIPANVTSLPEGVEEVYAPSDPAGAHQSLNYKKLSGYAGPCPPDGEHSYMFTLYALKVATLTGLTKDSTASAAKTAIVGQKLGSTTLKTKYTLAK